MDFDRVLPDPVRRRFGLKLAVALLVVTISAAAIGAWIHVQTSQTMQEDVEHELKAVSQMRAAELDTWLDTLRTETRAASTHPVFQSDDTERIRSHLNELVADEQVPEGVVAVHYLDTEEMTFITSSSEEMVGVSSKEQGAPFATDPPSFDGPNDAYVTEPFQVDAVDYPVMAVISPVPDVENRAVVYMVDVTSRSHSFEPFHENGNMIVVNSQGQYVVHENTEKILSTHKGGSDSMAVRMGVQGKTGFMDMQESGILMGFAPLETKDWVVMVHVPRADAYAVSSQVTTNIVLLLVVGAVGLGVIGLLVQRRVIRSLRTLADRADEMAEGNLGVDLKTNRIDEIGRLFGSFAQMRDSLHQEIESAEAARERAEFSKREAEQARQNAEDQRTAAEAAKQEAQALTDHLESKAVEYEDAMTACAEGDLTRRVDPDSQSDAMTAIGEALNDMLAALERTLADVTEFGEYVSTASTEVDAGAAEVMDASEEVSESVQGISDGAARQSENLADVSGQMSGLSASAEEVAATVSDVAELSQKATEVGERGQTAAQVAIDEMDAVEDRTEHTVEEIEALDAEMDAIGEIVEVITGVAEQTNLLALNASIEAARTGQEGEGFTVVADEIKRLAEETKESAGEIEERILNIQDQTSQTVRGVAETRASVSGAVDTVEETIESVERIVEHVQETNVAIQEIDEATQDQAESAQVVVNMVDEVASISEETTAEAQTVAAASEEQTATLNEVSSSAATLADRAEQLQDALADFEVDPDDAEETDFEFDELTSDEEGSDSIDDEISGDSLDANEAADPIDEFLVTDEPTLDD